ncbi:DUF945 family protein [Vibrio rumoiensis]|uniref:DUF945 domain-containing protein n=1 Tax=Vibrio rumoiensis 1S-45 TaxID=1188252 RepID=A0A1E5E2W4_9VIBR|nr:DUF945 family protein [Vibrio rumoiensis]OEF25907.1 hypothetical protein A1QC_07750 [Vibrio rumoiensis 1S-45]
MNNLKKYAAIGGAVAIVACWPLAIGQFAQSTITDAIQKLDQKEVKVEIVKYDRGYLTATAQTQVTVVDPALKQQLELNGLPTSFILDHQINHGLFSVSSDTRLDDYKALPATVHSVTYINGSSSVEMKSEKMEFNFANDLNSKLELSPGSMTADISRDGHVKFAYQLESFNGHFSNGESLLLKSISGSGDGKKVNGFWLGKQEAALGEVNMLTPTGESMVNVHQFNYQFNTEEKAEQKTFSSHHKISVDSIDVEDDTLTDLGLEVSFNDIDMPAFSALLDVYQTHGQDLTNDNVKSIMGQVDTLFEKGFSVAVNKIKATIRKGHFDGDLTLNFPAGKKNVTQNPMTIPASLTGGTNAFISNEMVTEFPFIQSGLDGLIQQGVMTHKTDGYHINGEVKDGNVEFKSGKKMPLFVLLAPLFM